MRLSFLSPFVLAAALIPHTLAWGTVGHEVVATIAQMHLHPNVMPKLCAILDYTGDCHLAPIATWADRVRRQGKYRWTAPLHYIGAVDDYPSATCAFPGSRGWEGRTHINVLHAIRNTTTVLQDFVSEGHHASDAADVPPYVQDALKFLIHFLGDMHMPLHLTGRDRGGNGDKVAFDGRTTNLHSVWDSLLIAERLRTLPHNYTRPLPLPDVEAYLRGTIYDPYIRRLVWEGLLGPWQDELETWLVCPSASTRAVSSSSVSPQPPLPTSVWQSALALFRLASAGTRGGVGEGVGEGEGGLGVDDDTLCPYAWAKPIHRLNCDIVFPKELDVEPTSASDARDEGECACGEEEGQEEGDDDDDDDDDPLVGLARGRRKSHYFELYTPEYAGVIKERWIIEKLLTQGGVRLAAVLNWIFAEPNEKVLRAHSML